MGKNGKMFVKQTKLRLLLKGHDKSTVITDRTQKVT